MKFLQKKPMKSEPSKKKEQTTEKRTSPHPQTNLNYSTLHKKQLSGKEELFVNTSINVSEALPDDA